MDTKLITTIRKTSDVHLRFNLKQMKDTDKLTQIMLVTTVNRQRIRIYTKLRIQPKYWNKKSYRCVANQPISLRDKKRIESVNKLLNEMEASIYQADNKLSESGKYLNAQIIRKAILEKHTEENADCRPIAYLYQQVEEYLNGLNRRGKRGIASTQRTYLTALKRLENFCQQQDHPIRTFEDFDHKFFTSFANYLYSCSYQKGTQKKQYTQNTVINTLKVIKVSIRRNTHCSSCSYVRPLHQQ